jgi:hypothetical protein
MNWWVPPIFKNFHCPDFEKIEAQTHTAGDGVVIPSIIISLEKLLINRQGDLRDLDFSVLQQIERVPGEYLGEHRWWEHPPRDGKL